MLVTYPQTHVLSIHVIIPQHHRFCRIFDLQSVSSVCWQSWRENVCEPGWSPVPWSCCESWCHLLGVSWWRLNWHTVHQRQCLLIKVYCSFCNLQYYYCNIILWCYLFLCYIPIVLHISGADPAIGGPGGRLPLRAWLCTLRKLCDSITL